MQADTQQTMDDPAELPGTIEWLEMANEWFRYNVEWTRKRTREDDEAEPEYAERPGIESILFKTEDLDVFLHGFNRSITALQDLKP